MKEDPEVLEAQQVGKNHGNTSTQSQSTDKVAPHLDLVQQPVDVLGDPSMDERLALVHMLGAHLPQVVGTQVHQVLCARHAQLNQALVHQLWATMKAVLQV